MLEQEVAQGHGNDNVDTSAYHKNGCEKPVPLVGEMDEGWRFERLCASDYTSNEARKRQNPADYTNIRPVHNSPYTICEENLDGESDDGSEDNGCVQAWELDQFLHLPIPDYCRGID